MSDQFVEKNTEAPHVGLGRVLFLRGRLGRRPLDRKLRLAIDHQAAALEDFRQTEIGDLHDVQFTDEDIPS